MKQLLNTQATSGKFFNVDFIIVMFILYTIKIIINSMRNNDLV